MPTAQETGVPRAWTITELLERASAPPPMPKVTPLAIPHLPGGWDALIESGSSTVWAKTRAKHPEGGISLFHFSDDLERAREIIAREEAKKMERRMRDALRRGRKAA